MTKAIRYSSQCVQKKNKRPEIRPDWPSKEQDLVLYIICISLKFSLYLSGNLYIDTFMPYQQTTIV